MSKISKKSAIGKPTPKLPKRKLLTDLAAEESQNSLATDVQQITRPAEQSVDDPSAKGREELRATIEAHDRELESKGICDQFWPKIYLVLYCYKGHLMVYRQSLNRDIARAAAVEMCKRGLDAKVVKLELGIDTIKLPGKKCPTSFRVSDIRCGKSIFPVSFELATVHPKVESVSIKQCKMQSTDGESTSTLDGVVEDSTNA